VSRCVVESAVGFGSDQGYSTYSTVHWRGLRPSRCRLTHVSVLQWGRGETWADRKRGEGGGVAACDAAALQESRTDPRPEPNVGLELGEHLAVHRKCFGLPAHPVDVMGHPPVPRGALNVLRPHCPKKVVSLSPPANPPPRPRAHAGAGAHTLVYKAVVVPANATAATTPCISR
jgi:hypothetical protein